MSWLDHILATPTIGCGFKPSFQTSNDYLLALRPLLKKWGETTDIVIDTDKALNLTIERKPGSRYSIEVDKLAVQYRYRYELKERPGQVVPALPIDFEVKKYGALLENVAEEFCEAFDHIVGSENRGLTRLGIVAACKLDGESLPPGVDLFIKHLARPWGATSLAKCNVHLLGAISENEKTRERCHHQLDIDDENKNIVRLTLDWQRVFLSEIQLGKGRLIREHIQKSVADALAYFERFGKGDLEYGDVELN